MIVGTGFPEALQRKITASVSFAVLLLGTVVKFTGTIIKIKSDFKNCVEFNKA